jgi:phosphoglycerate dehydrogenase-like enzyme
VSEPPRLLYVEGPYSSVHFPFRAPRLRERFRAFGKVTEGFALPGEPISEAYDLARHDFLCYFGGRLTERCVDAAPRLRAVATYTDNTGEGLPQAALEARGIPVIDNTRAAAPSVAEIALALMLCALRRIPMWHNSLAGQSPMRVDLLPSQFRDDPRFVNGTVATKRVGIVGLGQIGRRVAKYCRVLGASVVGYDPFLAAASAAELGVELVGIDDLVDRSEIVVVCVPPTPSARHLLDRARIGRLAGGSLVVVVTRAHAVDMDALRERIVADELLGAFDVYDVEPLPIDDPLRGRPNVVHLPHIAGRTVDHNTRGADLIADDFERVWRGEPPRNAVGFAAMAVRSQVTARPY